MLSFSEKRFKKLLIRCQRIYRWTHPECSIFRLLWETFDRIRINGTEHLKITPKQNKNQMQFGPLNLVTKVVVLSSLNSRTKFDLSIDELSIPAHANPRDRYHWCKEHRSAPISQASFLFEAKHRRTKSSAFLCHEALKPWAIAPQN